MTEREYTVIVNNIADLPDVEAELTASSGAGPIPDRTVDIANPRPGSRVQTHFMLTDDEAKALESDPRIRAVEIPPDQRTDISIGKHLTQQGNNFVRSTTHTANDINWGLVRCASTDNSVYQNNTTPSGNYITGMGGKNVDIVIQDSGIQADHPEWEDALTGTSRFQALDWYAASGLTGTQSANYYRDFDGHGTHCAGIAAGKTYGWAKQAHIYAQKLAGLEGSGDSGGTPISDAFDAIRLWHNAKTNGRPTVVNMSWGYGANLTTDPSSGNYRGNAWVWNPGEFQVGYDSRSGLWSGTGVVDRVFAGSPNYMRMPTRVASVDAEVDDLINAGVHVVIAAGNDLYKQDAPGGTDYDNTVVFGGTTYNYHRGSSPHSDVAGCFKVVNIDYHTQELIGDTGTDVISDSSTRGPGTDIMAPGTEIMSTLSNTNDYTDYNYPDNTSYKVGAISGTSMAAPQVAGVIAQHLEVFPEATPAQIKTRILNDAIDDEVYDPGQTDDYANYTETLLDTPNKFLYSKYNQQPVSFAGFSLTSAAQSATYVLSSSASSVNEGQSFTITLTTTGLSDNTVVSYAVSGIQAADLSSGDLTGEFTITSNTATASFTVDEDALTEGNETFTLTLLNGADSVDVTIVDTSITPVESYTLSSDVDNVNEGDSVVFTLTTTNVDDGTLVPYTITGVTSADIGGASLTGNFTVNSDTADVTISFAEDSTTEGAETIRLSLDNGEDFHEVTVNDTSQTPVTPDPTYTLSGVTGANEGDTITITLTTTNVDDATQVAYTVTGISSADLSAGTLTGYFTISSNTATVDWTLANDLTTEGTENMLISLDNGEDTHTVAIADSSRTPVYNNLSNDQSGAMNEGETVTFTLTSSDVPNGTTVGYTVTGIAAADLSSGSLSGNITMNSNIGTVSFTLANDAVTEGAETLTFTLAGTDSNGTATGGLSQNITIADTSIAFNADYTITVTNSGNSYNLSGTDRNGAVSGSQPALAFNDGDNVQFNVNSATASAHPFYIKTQQGAGLANQVNDVSGQGSETLQWTIDGTGTYYYQCRIHGAMNNTITVS